MTWRDRTGSSSEECGRAGPGGRGFSQRPQATGRFQLARHQDDVRRAEVGGGALAVSRPLQGGCIGLPDCGFDVFIKMPCRSRNSRINWSNNSASPPMLANIAAASNTRASPMDISRRGIGQGRRQQSATAPIAAG